MRREQATGTAVFIGNRIRERLELCHAPVCFDDADVPNLPIEKFAKQNMEVTAQNTMQLLQLRTSTAPRFLVNVNRSAVEPRQYCVRILSLLLSTRPFQMMVKEKGRTAYFEYFLIGGHPVVSKNFHSTLCPSHPQFR